MEIYLIRSATTRHQTAQGQLQMRAQLIEGREKVAGNEQAEGKRRLQSLPVSR